MIPTKKFVSKDDINFRWQTVRIPSSSSSKNGQEEPDQDKASSELHVSNDQAPFPQGLTVIPEFLSEEEASDLYREIQGYDFSWEGFEQRRRVKRFSVGDNNKNDSTTTTTNNIPNNLQSLINRVAEQTGHLPQYVSVEEHNSLQTLKITQYGSNGYNAILTGFESVDLCSCSSKGDCSCFVAHIPLRGSAVKHLNKPKRRHPTCFDLESSQHWTDVRIDANELLLQRSDCLWDWRARISAIPPRPEGKYQDTTFIIVKLYNLPEASSSSSSMPNGTGRNKESDGIDFDSFGYMGTPESELSVHASPMPPLEEVLTIIVTTSPIPSNPSTDIIERTFSCFHQAGSDFALKCRKMIVCDGFRQLDNGKEAVTRRHTNPKQAMRNGICTSDQAENYLQFKAALRELCSNASPDSPFFNSHVEELDSRHGYGFALRHALHHCITTPFVCVIQHDRTIMRPTPIHETTQAMWHHPNIKYVTMSMRSNLLYKDLFMGKYGKTYHEEFDDMVLRLPELNLEQGRYGPDSHSTKNITFNTQKVRDSLQGMFRTYNVSYQNLGQKVWLGKHPNEPGKHQLTLTPTLFWYDNVHIAETAHYRDFVFDPTYKMVKKGGFVEDKLSPVLTRTLEKLGLREGHSRFGCYLLDDHSGYFFTGHMDGGNYKTKTEKKALSTKGNAKDSPPAN